jgi:hypothetical protein
MSTNLLSLAQQALGSDFSNLAGKFLGESPTSTKSAMDALLPVVLCSTAKKGATADGAASLLSLIGGANMDTGMLGNLAGLLGGGSALDGLMKIGGSSLVPALFGSNSNALAGSLASISGIKSSSATSLIALLVPLVLMFLKKHIGEKSLNANSLASLLSSQGQHLQGGLDNRMLGALGYSGSSPCMAASSHVAATPATLAAPSKPGFLRWLPWLLLPLLLLFLWNLFNKKEPDVVVPETAMTAPAAAILPANVYFDVDSPVVGAEGNQTIASVAAEIKRDNVMVAITGHTDRTGDVAHNEELAKNRATAVHDALVAAGVAESNIDMRPPMFIEVGAAGSDRDARRVEISKK